MTVYEMIQELCDFPADAEVNFCIEGQGIFEEIDTGKDAYVEIKKNTIDISGSYERKGKCFFDITI